MKAADAANRCSLVISAVLARTPVGRNYFWIIGVLPTRRGRTV